MKFSVARQANGARVWFTVSQSGSIRSGIAADVTATVVDPDDSASTTPAVSESLQKPGLYYFDIANTFFDTNGLGDYALVVEANANAPKLNAVASGILRVVAEDIDSVITTYVFSCP